MLERHLAITILGINLDVGTWHPFVITDTVCAQLMLLSTATYNEARADMKCVYTKELCKNTERNVTILPHVGVTGEKKERLRYTVQRNK